jgi:transcriptional antiterminator
MKNQITIIATSIVLAFSSTSCTDDTDAFIQKIEATQTELKQQDSILVTYRSELSSVAFTNTTKNNNPDDSLFNNLSQKINPLITRLELMIEKNKSLVEQVKNNSGDSKQVEKDYTAQLDELELMKPEISAVKTDYEKIVAIVSEAFESVGDTTKMK